MPSNTAHTTLGVSESVERDSGIFAISLFFLKNKKIPSGEFFVKFLSFIHSTDTAGTNFFLLSVNLFLLNINLKFSFSGNIGVTSGMSGSGSSVANFTSFTHNIIDISRIKILGRHSVKSGFRF